MNHHRLLSSLLALSLTVSALPACAESPADAGTLPVLYLSADEAALYDDETGLHPAWTAVSVYLNDDYYGEYTAEEQMDAAFIASALGLDSADGITVLSANGTLVEGSAEDQADYRSLLIRARAVVNGTSDEGLQDILDQVDVDNYLTFMAFQVYVGNSDCSSFRCYRVSGGKWQWALCDADWALFNSAYDAAAAYTT